MKYTPIGQFIMSVLKSTLAWYSDETVFKHRPCRAVDRREILQQVGKVATESK